MDTFIIILLIAIYQFIWLTPMYLFNKRKKNGLDGYWTLLIITCFFEFCIVYSLGYLLVNILGYKHIFFIFLPPIVGSIFALVFYQNIANYFDRRKHG